MRNYKEFLIEKFIPGREIQVAIMGNQKLGAIELRPKRKFYDYKAKYQTNAKMICRYLTSGYLDQKI